MNHETPSHSAYTSTQSPTPTHQLTDWIEKLFVALVCGSHPHSPFLCGRRPTYGHSVTKALSQKPFQTSDVGLN